MDRKGEKIWWVGAMIIRHKGQECHDKWYKENFLKGYVWLV
jgi:hypothetical protein